MDAPDTEINGGLVLTSLIGLRDTGGNTTAGINGITEKSAKGGGIAAWFGGEMVDKDYNDGSKTPANTIFRFDGSGYVAGGAIWWGTDGRVHADPTSFIISEKNLGAYLTFFEPTWKSGSAGTSVADLVSLKPNAPFSKLGVSGDATFEGAITFHGIKITYDSTNKAIKIDGNLYATGGISAYGASDGAGGGGGGLNGSVKSYSEALKLTSESLSEIASAYSIKALASRISSLEGGSATAISVSGNGNAVTSVTKNGTTISVVKGSTFLTTHQSLAGYATQSWVNGKGYITSSASITGNAGSATKLQTARSIWGQSFNGTGDVNGTIYIRATEDWYLKIDNTNNWGYRNLLGHGWDDGNGDYIKFHVPNADTWSSYFIFTKLGKMGINTSPSEALHVSGNILATGGFKKNGSDDNYVLLGGGGHKSISGLSVSYASSAGSANSVAWSNVSGRPSSLPASDVYSWAKASTKPSYSWSEIGSRPTKVSQFSNDSGYITSSASITGNAGSATKLQTARSIWGQSFNGTGDVNGTIYIRATEDWYLKIDNTNNWGYRNLLGHGWDDGNGDYIKFHVPNADTWSSYFIFTKSGRMGINTSPSEALHVSGNILATGGITAYSSSDIRLKQNLHKLNYLNIIKAMGGSYSFTWRKDNKHSIGWIAQHVLSNPYMRDIVETDEKGYYKINYWSPKLIATAFGAIEQVGDEVSRLKARVVFLESEVQRLSGEQVGSDNKRLDNKNINSLN